MIVGMDGGGLLRPETGIGRYTVELIRALGALGDGPELRLLVNSFRNARPAALPEDLPGALHNPRLPHRVLHGLWRTVRWPPADRLVGGADVFHASDWALPPTGRAALVTTVHDIGALVRPEWYTPDVVARHREKNRTSVERADAIVTVSSFTRDELLRHFDADPERVVAVPNGVSPEFVPPPPDRAAELRREIGLEGPYLLYVGTREPRKNLPGLIEIFRRIADEAPPELGFVVAGMRPWAEARAVQGVAAWNGRDVEEAVGDVGLGHRVLFPGQVPFDTLLALYAGATAFVFPTLYEGFGLPALEAMACGAPVVASDRSALPEVVGDAGLLVDPEDPDAFAAAVLRVVADEDLARTLRTRGRERAARFTWERTARETLAVYRKAVDAGSV